MWGLKLSLISPSVKENYSNFALDWAQSFKLLKRSSRLLTVMVVGRKVVLIVSIPPVSQFLLINNHIFTVLEVNKLKAVSQQVL